MISLKKSNLKIVQLLILLSYNLILLWAFFDGAAQLGKSGGGILLELSHSHNFHIWMGCGTGTNTCQEMLTL